MLPVASNLTKSWLRLDSRGAMHAEPSAAAAADDDDVERGLIAPVRPALRACVPLAPPSFSRKLPGAHVDGKVENLLVAPT